MNNGGKYGNFIRDARLFAALNPITVQNETLLRQHNLKKGIQFFPSWWEPRGVERRSIGANRSYHVGLVLVYYREVRQNLAVLPKQ